MTIYALTDRAVLRISGNDSRTLLQGIITNNVALLESQPALFSALLTPQGKFLYDFFLVRDGDDLLVDIYADWEENFIKKLMMYKLRADMQIVKDDTLRVYATGLPQDGICFTDPRNASLDHRIISSKIKDTLPLTDYHIMRLEHAVPDGAYDAVQERSVLLELGYDALNAIDFHKGCYIGQEVTARAKHRGTLRKSLMQVRGKCNLPAYGTAITAQGKAIGEMRSSQGNIGLALLRHDPLQTAQQSGNAIMADNTVLIVNSDNITSLNKRNVTQMS